MPAPPKKFCSISADSIIVYDFYEGSKKKPKMTKSVKANLAKAYKSPVLSKGSARKIKKIITHWMLAINMTQKKQKGTGQRKRRYMVMITLTLPSVQNESDKEIKRNYLNNFLIQLKSKHDVKNYLWVAEKQKNGNIHFHICVDKWCNKFQIQRLWNKVLSNGVYLSNYQQKFGNKLPPNVKITGQKEMANPAEYLTKYVTKAEKTQPIDGVKWACTVELQEITKIKFLCKDWYRDFLYYYKDVLKVKYFENDYVQVFYFDGNFLNDFMYHDLFLDNEDSFAQTYSLIYPELTPQRRTPPGAKVLKNPAPIQLQMFENETRVYAGKAYDI